MAISFVGSATGITSATLPTHEVGDLIVAFAFRDGTTTIPTLGSGFTSIITRTGTSSACRVGFIRATVTNTASGTWTNATSVVFVIYRDVGSIGSSSVSSGTSTTVTFPAVNLTNQTGSSWIVGFVGSSSTNVAIETAPSGMVNRTSVSDATDEAAAHDTNSGSSTFTSRTATIGGTSGNWVSASIELIDGSATASVSSFALLADNFIYPETSNWYPWYFGPRTVGYSGESNVLFDGISASSDFSKITAIGEQSAVITIDGILLNSDFSELLSAASSNITIDGIETFTSQGDVSITISDSEIVNGIEAVGLAGQATATADAYFEQSGIFTETDISQISALADANYSINGNESITSFDAVSVTGDSVFVISGIQASADKGKVTADTIVRVNASVELDGINTTASLGNVFANSESPETWSSGQIRRYPANQFVSAIAKTASVSAKFEIGEIQTNATTVINATISLNNVVSFVQASDINASGTLEISDEELILLLAA